VSGGATHEAAFLAINPKAKVPTLMRDDGSVLTGFSAIATWLARTNPGQHLLADDPEETRLSSCAGWTAPSLARPKPA